MKPEGIPSVKYISHEIKGKQRKNQTETIPESEVFRIGVFV